MPSNSLHLEKIKHITPAADVVPFIILAVAAADNTPQEWEGKSVCPVCANLPNPAMDHILDWEHGNMSKRAKDKGHFYILCWLYDTTCKNTQTAPFSHHATPVVARVDKGCQSSAANEIKSDPTTAKLQSVFTIKGYFQRFGLSFSWS